MEAVLVSNGPGELYAWAQPVLRALRETAPELKISIALVPDQFVSGNEAAVARTFGADVVTTHRDFMSFLATGKRPPGLGAERGFVLSLGGNVGMALRLAGSLGYPTYRYSFVPTWHRKLRKLYVVDAKAERRARLLGAPGGRLEAIGNLVADAVAGAEPACKEGSPHILLLTGTRDAMSVLLIPFMLGLADTLGQTFPNATFTWPVSQLLQDETVKAGIAGRDKDVLGGVVAKRDGDMVTTPSGIQVKIVPETERYAYMRSADLGLTIPGTNTLELGVAGVPSVVVLPMNKPEVIPLEGIGHWLGLVPLIGTTLKRYAVKAFVEGLDVPVSLPNRFSGEDLMLEIKGNVSVAGVAAQASQLLNDPADLERRRERLLATMPRAGAAARLVGDILEDIKQLEGKP